MLLERASAPGCPLFLSAPDAARCGAVGLIISANRDRDGRLIPLLSQQTNEVESELLSVPLTSSRSLGERGYRHG